MPNASRTISINTSPERAFAFFADPVNDKRWRRHVKEISASGAPGVGGKVHQIVEGPGGRGIAADIEITTYEPPTRYAFSVITGPARPNGEFRVAPTAAGVDVTFSLAAELSGIKKLFMSGPVQSSMDGEMAALDTAKALLEAS